MKEGTKEIIKASAIWFVAMTIFNLILIQIGNIFELNINLHQTTIINLPLALILFLPVAHAIMFKSNTDEDGEWEDQFKDYPVMQVPEDEIEVD